MTNNFKTDDRVILTNMNIAPCESWPVWGSEYANVGTITDVRNSLVWVDWDNGKQSMILASNLSYSADQEKNSSSPNLAFIKHKLRKTNERF